MRKALFLLVSLSFSFAGLSQKFGREKIDSLKNLIRNPSKEDTFFVNTLNAISYEYRKISTDTGLIYSNKALSSSTKINYTKGKSEAKVCIGINLQSKGNLDSAFQLVNTEIPFITDQKVLAYAYNCIGNVYLMKGSDTLAFKEYMVARKLFYEIRDKRGMAMVCRNLSNIYYMRGEINEAFRLLDSELVLRKEIGDVLEIAGCYATIAVQHLQHYDNEEAIRNYEEAVKIAKKLKNVLFEAGLYNQMGVVFMNADDNISALNYYTLGWQLSKQVKDTTGIKNGLLNMAAIYSQVGKVGDAINNYFELWKLCEATKDTAGIASAYASLAVIYSDIGDVKKAKEYNEYSLKIDIQLDNQFSIALDYARLAANEMLGKNYEGALAFYNKALGIWEKIGDRREIASTYSSVANVYYETGNLEESKIYFKKAKALADEMQEKYTGYSVALGMGKIFLKQRKCFDAEKQLNISLEIAKEIKSIQYMKDANKALYDLYCQTGQYQKALESYKSFIEARDSLNNKDVTKKLVQKQMQFDFDKKEDASKAEQNRKDIQARLHLQKERIILGTVSCGFLLVAVMAFLAFRGYQQKKRDNLIIEQEKRKSDELLCEVQLKNKEITDNINYALRIQNAILPDIKLIYKTLCESFLLYLPKDIVSGDFYGFAERNGKVVIIAADCTGHGVSGAFMSMIGSSLLNQIINERNITEPAEILRQLNIMIIESLNQNENETNDGMDVSICVFNAEMTELQYAGANRPLWVIRNNELITLSPDKHPIGGLQVAMDRKFSNHKVDLCKGDTLYLFSDGFADQFGGEKGKKLMTSKFKAELLAIQDKTMREQEYYLKTYFDRWKGKNEQVDDVLVIGIRV